MKRFLLLAALAAFSLPTFADTGTATVSGVTPTTYESGAAMPASAISGYDIDCMFTPTGGAASSCTGSFTPITGSVLAGSVTFTYPGATGGRACFRARVKTVAGGMSVFSPVGPNSCKDFAAAVPSAPGAITVTVTVNVSP